MAEGVIMGRFKLAKKINALRMTWATLTHGYEFRSEYALKIARIRGGPKRTNEKLGSISANHHHPLQLRDGAVSTCHVFGVKVVIGTHNLNNIQSPSIALAMVVFFYQYHLGLVQQT